MKIAFHPLPTETVERIRQTGLDAYGTPVERHHVTGSTRPCRHCLGQTSDAYLVLAHRPFTTLNPYAETGPIFLCDEDCLAPRPTDRVPDVLRSPAYIVRAYTARERILYGTGQVTPTGEIAAYAQSLFDNRDVAFVDVRSAANNCFQCRITRA
ncbi:MAG: DUF1203 domain-containing protein [Silicimonas sp.]|nr:DUF1203 domain-containing protein [Silicimonas sp.]